MVDSSSSSTQSSLDREEIKTCKEKTEAKLELEPALPTKVRRDRAGVVVGEADKYN